MEQTPAWFATGLDWRTAVAIAATLVAVAALLVAGLVRRRLARVEAAAAELEQALGQLAAGARGQQQRHRALAAELRRTGERLGQLELRAVSRPYEQAIRMAAQGGSEDGLMRYFGLTDGEAALVRLLHGDSRRSRSSKSASTTRRA